MVFGLENSRIAKVAVAILFLAFSVGAQTQTGPEKQFWPELNVHFRVASRTSVQINLEKHDGEDTSDQQWKFVAFVNYRMRRILRSREDPDEENKYNLVVGAGYEFIRTGEGNSVKIEHRLLVQSTPKYRVGPGLLAQDRNRVEFRWNNGTYDFRYRNKLTIDRPLKIKKVRFTPYASGELFWDRNHHSWNENQYALGVQWPYKKHFKLDTYYLHQNCTTSSQTSVNVFGLTANFYLN